MILHAPFGDWPRSSDGLVFLFLCSSTRSSVGLSFSRHKHQAETKAREIDPVFLVIFLHFFNDISNRVEATNGERAAGRTMSPESATSMPAQRVFL
jgi:hypothetical protein